MISVMESVLREAAAVAVAGHESWSPHLRMQIKTGCQASSGGFMEIASSTSSYVGTNEEDSTSPVTPTPTSRDQDSPQTTMESRLKKSKTHRDPTSHRVIEKRRRDRMNNCLTNLSKLIPSNYLKKGRGRIEKTEIIEMAIRFMKDVEMERRQQLNHQKRATFGGESVRLHDEFMLDKSVGTTDDQPTVVSQGSMINSPDSSTKPATNDRYRQGFFDCVAEIVRFLAGAEGHVINEQIKTKLLLHLRDYFSTFSFGTVDATCSSNESKRGYYRTPSAFSQHEDYCCPSTGGDDEPLNMSIKRPRHVDLNAAANGGILRCGSSGAWIANNGGAATLRGILECKGDAKTAAAVIEVKREPSSLATHHQRSVPLTLPLAQIQHRFTSILEQPACLFGGGSAVAMKIPPNGGCVSVTHYGGGGGGGSSSGSTQYPSSPSSSASYGMDSPPHSSHSPASTTHRGVASLRSNNNDHHLGNRTCHHSNGGSSVPVFALHPLGLFYVPLIVNSCCLEDASFQTTSATSPSAMSAEQVQSAMAVSHPVTICVNFNFSASVGYYGNGHHSDQRTERSHQQTATVAQQQQQQSSVILATPSLSRLQ